MFINDIFNPSDGLLSEALYFRRALFQNKCRSICGYGGRQRRESLWDSILQRKAEMRRPAVGSALAVSITDRDRCDPYVSRNRKLFNLGDWLGVSFGVWAHTGSFLRIIVALRFPDILLLCLLRSGPLCPKELKWPVQASSPSLKMLLQSP